MQKLNNIYLKRVGGGSWDIPLMLTRTPKSGINKVRTQGIIYTPGAAPQAGQRRG